MQPGAESTSRSCPPPPLPPPSSPLHCVANNSHLYSRDVGGRERPKKTKKIFLPLSKHDNNQKSHERHSVSSFLVHGSRITCPLVQFDGRVVTVIYWYKLIPKMGLETEKVKNGVRIQDIYRRPHFLISLSLPEHFLISLSFPSSTLFLLDPPRVPLPPFPLSYVRRAHVARAPHRGNRAAHRRKQSTNSRCGARAMWARPTYDVEHEPHEPHTS